MPDLEMHHIIICNHGRTKRIRRCAVGKGWASATATASTTANAVPSTIAHSSTAVSGCYFDFGLLALVSNRLIGGADAGVEDRLHGSPCVRIKACPLVNSNPSGQGFGRSFHCPL